MGYRLHAHKHYNPTYVGGVFNGDYEEWSILFADKFSDNGWIDMEENECEVNRKDLEGYSDYLKTLKPKGKNRYFKSYTNEEVIGALEELLQSGDEHIRMEWF